jgi:ABC-type Zn2+ transport system substrate-binding protein/surface adhesin
MSAPASRALQQEGVAVVEEVHALRGERVHGFHMAAQGFLHAFLNAAGSFTISALLSS